MWSLGFFDRLTGVWTTSSYSCFNLQKSKGFEPRGGERRKENDPENRFQPRSARRVLPHGGGRRGRKDLPSKSCTPCSAPSKKPLLSTTTKGVFSCILGKNETNIGKIGLSHCWSTVRKPDFLFSGRENGWKCWCTFWRSLRKLRTPKRYIYRDLNPKKERLPPFQGGDSYILRSFLLAKQGYTLINDVLHNPELRRCQVAHFFG